ncbi:integrase catalytic domain-containing protein [Trichonephila clavipes]|nr:integrase catalytic domain-containing protein [Trichonephila clavipes]
MIWINPDQRKLQRILWRENMDEPIKTFELSTVTYGTTSAPFLATRTLKQLALDEAGNFPLGSSVVMSDMYIDDVLTGAETLLEAKELKNQLINIFAKGGMVLHKWCGNNTELIEVSENYDFSDSSEIKVLGVYWNPKHDCFSFRVKIDLHELNTKRDVLSTIARIYDPLGLLGPVVAKLKIFLQKLWMLKIDWTDLLPDTINREWLQFVESLQVVNDININRCIVVEQLEVIELHGFSDASQSAYGAVVYCKSITSDRKMLVHLIDCKSRVAPTKQTTIPRLELCAAVLLAKLVHRVKQALKLNVTNTFLWSDSMIVLSWIRKESYQLKTFVANRIATIQEMTSSEQWRYVATEDNPADFVSRGMDSLKLKTCELWWNGPKFLMSNQYPQRQIPVAVIKDPGRSITSIVEPDLSNLNENRLDNWQKITKIIQLIWKRWSVDYLNSLQQRNKWHFEKKNAKIGDMVIIKEDNLPSCQWSLGRINNIYPGKDSKVRVVEVKTTRVTSGETENICPLKSQIWVPKYETKLPWKSNPEVLDCNFETAKRRFDNLKITLSKIKVIGEEYKRIIDEQLKNGIVEECRDISLFSGYFMPHQAVIRPDKETSRVRIVFDASSKGKNSESLNDLLFSGPNLMPDLLHIILKFRKYEIAFCSDIEKAFLNISIAQEDRKYLKFLWFDIKNNENFKVMNKQRLSFGVTSSPFILTTTIKSHLQKHININPECVNMLNSSLYVDDQFYGSDTVNNAYKITSDAIDILKHASMNLCKFNSNSPKLKELWLSNTIAGLETFRKQYRILEILNLTNPSCWQHCPGKSNSADRLTRGFPVQNLTNDDLWWYGPKWLRENKLKWPKLNDLVIDDKLKNSETRPREILQNLCTSEFKETIVKLENFDSLLKVKRIIAWVKRFIFNCRNISKFEGPLSADELSKAEEHLVREVQMQHFREEINMLNRKQILKNSKLYSLRPYLDVQDILRISSRINELNSILMR